MTKAILASNSNLHEFPPRKLRQPPPGQKTSAGPVVNPDSAIIWTTRLTTTCAGLVILAAGVLGYTALRDLFVSIGLFATWLALLFPLLFDLAEVTAAMSVLNARLQGEEDKFAWCMVLLFTALGIVANIGHATRAYWTGRIDPGQFILAVFATSLFPLSVALVTHLLKRVITRDIIRRSVKSSLAELSAREQAGRTELDKLKAQLDKLTGQIEAAKTKLKALNDDLEAGQTRAPSPIATVNDKRQAKMVARRQEVVSLLQQNLSDRDIAGRLEVSVKTIRRDIEALNGNGRGAK